MPEFLTVEQQRLLVEGKGFPTALCRLLLSTGMHPSVLTQYDVCRLTFDSDQYSYQRPKTRRKIIGLWSRAMREPGMLEEIVRNVGCSRVWYYQVVARRIATKCMTRGSPLTLRHTYFVNRARLGHNVLDIAHSAGTSMDTIYRYYTVGMGDAKRLSEDDLEFLRWLMEV